MRIKPDYSKIYLLPPSIVVWVSENHPVRFIREFVDSIDLSAYGFEENEIEEGRRRIERYDFEDPLERQRNKRKE